MKLARLVEEVEMFCKPTGLFCRALVTGEFNCSVPSMNGLLQTSGQHVRTFWTPELLTQSSYGKDYAAGKSYGRFSETINAVTSRRPALRRQVAAAWDLAFNWAVDEPHEHHSAVPLSVMLALCGLALLWGWAREACIIAISWTGVMRIGEVVSACRQDLVLPCDAAPCFLCVLLKIRQPKTRGRAARHQSAKIEPTDIVQLIEAVNKRSAPTERLWHLSPATLGKRFNALQAAIGLCTRDGSNGFVYSLASLRPGGATHWLQVTEDAGVCASKR